ncbi:hypothetical protein TSUD_42530 [Trifolium subterraneum]|uniref:Uncharacterized protein n=1 Tax=Trifolium subterraneum TaxID=3900 RepID=A0A2Z6MJP8_TRISU|nr:hypothetical protein TSUD_42530 [Trifolium subterraneum]
MKEKHVDEEFLKVLNDFKALRIGSSTNARIEDLYKQLQDIKLRFYNSLESSQLTKDEYQRQHNIIHTLERLFQIHQFFVKSGDEKLGFEDRIERMNEVIKLLKDFMAQGIDVGIDLAELEEAVKMHKELNVLKSGSSEIELKVLKSGSSGISNQ